VDWISGVGENLQISQTAIHHCVLIMDLYCSTDAHITSQELQLVAICCLMISSKYYEMKYPSASSLNTATRNAYTYQQIIDREGEILRVINWDLHHYTTLDYLNLFLN
jgi:cyclin A